MARKSIEFNVVFHFPKEDEGRCLLSKTMGEVHTKIIGEVTDRKIVDIDQKNKIITGVQKQLLGKG